MANSRKGCCYRLEHQQIDGGWAWMVFVAGTMNHMILIPMISNFTLIYKDSLTVLNISSQEITTIVTTNIAFGMILSVLNAPLLKRYGSRRVAYCSAVLFCLGFYSTSKCTTTLEYIIAFGMITSIGHAFFMAAITLAFNTYFRSRRRHVTGYMMTIAGVSQVAFPILISFLLSEYGVQTTVLVLTGISLHLFISASLLRPLVNSAPAEKPMPRPKRLVTQISVGPTDYSLVLYHHDDERKPVISLPLSANLPEEKDEEYKPVPVEVIEVENDSPSLVMYKSVSYLDNENYEEDSSWYKSSTFDKKAKMLASVETLGRIEDEEDENRCSHEESAENEERSCINKLIRSYDLDLLTNPSYVVTVVSMGLAIAAEVTFYLMIPFILQDFGLDIVDIARFYSVSSIGDIILRFFAPYIGDCLKFQTKMMYAVALLTVFLSRIGLFLATNFEGFMCVAVLIGMARGFRIIYWVLVIPDTVPLEKLASASAIQAVCTGILTAISGPITGYIVTLYGDYKKLVIVSNVLTLIPVILLTADYYVVRNKRKNNVRM